MTGKKIPFEKDPKTVKLPNLPPLEDDAATSEIKVQRNVLVPLMFDLETQHGYKIFLSEEQIAKIIDIIGEGIEFEVSRIWVPVNVHNLIPKQAEVPAEDSSKE